MAKNISLNTLIGLNADNSYSVMDINWNRKGIHFSISKVDKDTSIWCLKVFGKGSTWSKLFTDYKQIFHYEIPIGILAEKRSDLI